MDTINKSWLSNENNLYAWDCATWQALIGWNTPSVNTTSIVRLNKMLSYHRSMSHQ